MLSNNWRAYACYKYQLYNSIRLFRPFWSSTDELCDNPRDKYKLATKCAFQYHKQQISTLSYQCEISYDTRPRFCIKRSESCFAHSKTDDHK